jgi:hypothetical protein
MKKIFLQRLAMAMTTLVLYTYVPAQTALTTGAFKIGNAGSHAMLLTELKAKNAKSFSHFTNAYPDAILQKIRDEKDGTHINATVNGNTLRVHYDVKGKFRDAVLTYPSSDLSEKIADQVMQAFPGFTVFGSVTDVTVRNKSALLVMIENRKSWKRVRLVDDGIDVYEEYMKPSK